MGYHRIDVKRVPEQIVEQIINMIKNGEISLGEKLPSEDELSQRFSVSRATVREALSGLKTMGLVVSYSGKGTFVKGGGLLNDDRDKAFNSLKSRNDYIDVLEARRAIEKEICHLAAERATAEDLKAIQSAVENCFSADTIEIWRQADREFHISLAKATNNRLFIRLQQELFTIQLQSYWAGKMASNKDMVKKFNDEHQAIYKSIAAGNASAAKKLIIQHLHTIEENTLEI